MIGDLSSAGASPFVPPFAAGEFPPADGAFPDPQPASRARIIIEDTMNSSFFFIRVNPSLVLLRLDLKLTSIVKSATLFIHNAMLLFIVENDFHRFGRYLAHA
ncbi:hypothetical protein D3C73_1407990 [compost metagenome]